MSNALFERFSLLIGPRTDSRSKPYRRRRWHHLAEERIEDVKPQIPLGRRFWTLSQKERADIEGLFRDEAVMAKILVLKGRQPDDEDFGCGRSLLDERL